MNSAIFQRLFGNEVIGNAIISCSESEDDVGVVLRLHLITENYLEAFICSAIQLEHLFDTDLSNGKPFKLNYYKKLEFASKLGLPNSSLKALEKLNHLRNQLAHRIQSDLVDDATITSLSDHVRSIDGDTTLPLVEEQAEFFNFDGSSRAKYSVTSVETPNRIKLMILVLALIRRTTLKCFDI